MSLSKKLLYMGYKIDYYTNLLNNKTDELNNVKFGNNYDNVLAIKEWNKNKFELHNQLKLINNSLNNFASDSIRYINSIQQNKFGETDEDSDKDLQNKRLEYYTNEDLNVRYYKLKKDLILSEKNDINKKLIYCFIFGLFFLYKDIDISFININRIIFDNHYNDSVKFTQDFLMGLHYNNAYLAGGFINMCINYPTTQNLINTDLDIYINRENFKEFYEYISNNFIISKSKVYFSSPYTESFFKRNGLLSRLTLKLKNIKIDILIIYDERDIKDVINDFDLTYCSVYIDPKEIKVDDNDINKWKLPIEGETEDMIEKSGKLRDDYATNYLFNPFIQKRLNKYTNRGYKTLIQTKIDKIYESKKSKIITNELIFYTLFKHTYYQYKNLVYLGEFVFLISVKYTKDNLDDLCKYVSEYLYNNKIYYLYLQNEIIKTFIKSAKQDEEEEKYNDNKSLQDIIEVMNALLEENIEKAKEEKIPMKLPPKNILIFTNPRVSNFLQNLFDDEKIENSLVRFSISLQSEMESYSEISETLFSELITKTLLESDNNILSNPSLINFIITIVNYIYKEVYEENMNLLPEEWYLQEKVRVATLNNSKNYNLTIINYNDKDNEYDKEKYLQKNFKNINYFDLYEYEEKTFFEAYEDDNNILFIIDNENDDIKLRYTGFIYSFETLTTNDLQEFILECTQEVPGAPMLTQIKNKNSWYNQLSSPYNIGVSTSQLYQALSLYKYTNKKTRLFILSNKQYLNYISNIKNISWRSSGINLWGDNINLISGTHCGIGMDVYNEILFLNEDELNFE